MSKKQKILWISGGSAVILTALLLILFLIVLPIFKNSAKDDLFTIRSLAIQIDKKNIDEEVNTSFIEDGFRFEVVINDNKDADKDTPIIEWAIISEENLNCSIDNDGNFTIGDTLGTLKIRVNAVSKNTMSAVINVNIIAPDNFILKSIEAISPQNGLHFIEGQSFEPNELKILANFSYEIDSFQVFVSDFNYIKNTELSIFDTETDISFVHNGIERIVSVPLVVEPKKLQSIEISKSPITISYIEGQYFDTDGLEVTAHYEYIDTIVNDYVVTGADEILKPETSSVYIAYTDGGITKTASQKIVVAPRTLQSIIIDTPPKLNYVQGQAFRTDGLRVLARYEYFDRDITNEINLSKSTQLCHTDELITISYTEKEITKYIDIPIVVKKPYEEVRRIVFENPLDATLSWIYRYATDEGDMQIDNTGLKGNDSLQFDHVNGIYVAPVGAIITVMRVNPIVTDFVIDGNPCKILYPENSLDFELDFGAEYVKISFKKVIGEKITVRFAMGPNQNNWAFVYPLNYNNTMRVGDLAQIARIYEDNSVFYFQYTIGNDIYSLTELGGVIINSNTLISVSRVERIESELISIKVLYPEGVYLTFIVDPRDRFAYDKLPRVNRVGYSLDFSLASNGAPFNAESFNLWLSSASNNDVIHAVYTLRATPATGETVGVWEYVYDSPEHVFSLTLSFNSNGTYSYEFILDGWTNCGFSGIYDTADESIKILSIESASEYQLISVEDFKVSLNSDKLNATLFVIEGLNVMKGSVELTKKP